MNTKSINKGCIKFNSIKQLAESHNIPYITLYMRIRAGMSVSQACHKKVRKYTKRNETHQEVA